eukprot:CAMPEP_0194307672 /NCGR_PEP_ID=MMETSP0171-20130528/4564_1 /TAXON_ID=218684 /ORGANISM="Corethron pennatum, Strain L29A3" /LENGTH=42 /DNA_ID= /DNA_START= /DNA_END= /DNA_ORIENTATION=
MAPTSEDPPPDDELTDSPTSTSPPYPDIKFSSKRTLRGLFNL